MIKTLFLLGARFSGPVFLLVSLVTLITVSGLTRLEIDTSFGSLIPQDDPNLAIYQKIIGDFGVDRNTIVFVSDQDLWTPDKLKSLYKLDAELKRLDHVQRVESLFKLRNLIGKRSGNAIKLRTEMVIDELPETRLDADEFRLRALGNPLFIGTYISRDGRATALHLSLEETENNEILYAEIERILDSFRTDFDQVFQIGRPRVSAEIRATLISDFLILGPVTALTLIVCMLYFLRTSLAVFVPITTALVSIIWTFGVMGWLGLPLNLLSAMIPPLIIVIGSTEDTHMLTAFLDALGDHDEEKAFASFADAKSRAIVQMAVRCGLPLVLTVMTTTLGFASNLFSSIVLIRDFAIASTIAMLANGIVTILLVPLLLNVFGRAGNLMQKSRRPTASTRFLNRLTSLFSAAMDKYPSYTLGFTAMVCVFFAIHATRLHVTNDPLSYFSDDRALVREARLVQDKLSGVKAFFISLQANSDNAFLEPDNLAKLERIQEFLDKQSVFDSSLSIADHLKYVNQQIQGEFAQSSLPHTRELVAQYLLFFHRNELESFVSHDYRVANIIVRHKIEDSRTLNRYVRELSEFASDIAGPEMQARVLGENLMINQAAGNLIRSQAEALALLLAFIFVLMSILFTSLKGGAIAIIPCLIPIVLMFGAMGFLRIPLNPGTAMVAVIAVGIAIDGSIHLLARYSELCPRTSDYRGAVRQSVRQVARPLIVSGLSLALGFGVLMFSHFAVVAQFGALAAATMVTSVLANLLITPIVMTKVRLIGLYQMLGMGLDQKVLAQALLFKGMNAYQRRKAILISELHEFEPGERLMTQGHTERSMYMILSGEATVVRNDDEQSRVLATRGPGETIGEIGYIRASERTADVVARTPVRALRFDYERMQNDLRYFPGIVARVNFNISAILGEHLSEMIREA